MRIGIVSDTHGHLSHDTVAALEGCDAIIHAGDIGASRVLLGLEAIAPVTAVLGNCDYNDYGPQVRAVAAPLFEGVRFKVVHRPSDVGFVEPDVAVVVCGHTHKPLIEQRGAYLYVNPGSASSPRDAHPFSIALIDVDAGRVLDARIVEF